MLEIQFFGYYENYCRHGFLFVSLADQYNICVLLDPNVSKTTAVQKTKLFGELF